MKILMTTDAVGGVWHYSIDLAACLLKEKIEVAMVCTGPEPLSTQLETVKKLQKKGLAFYHSPYQLEWMDNPWAEVDQADEWIKDIVKAEKPSLLHFNSYAPASLDWVLPVVLVAHSCVASWWQMVKQEALPRRYERYFKTVQSAFQKSDVVIFPSRGLLESCKELYGPISNPRVIYNGLAIPLADPLYEISSKRPVLFSMGRLWDEAKNIVTLLKAAPFIAGEIFIAGSKVDNTPSPANVRFLGELSRQQILNWLKLSAVYVLPVKYEPFGLSFLEAASCRCALVGGDIPTLREIWGYSMSYAPTDDHVELARICNHLLDHPLESRKKGEEAYQIAKKYTLSRKADHYMIVYGSLTQEQLE